MSSESVRVMVRARPFNDREKGKGCKNCIEADMANCQVILNNPTDADLSKAFGYDAVFPTSVSQQTVYEQSSFPIIESVLDGYNGTIFAYGQTGCGKTHTMMGNPAKEELRGIIPRAFEHIFGKIGSSGQKNYLIRCSYIEIYNEEIHDLIGKDWNIKLELKESSDKGLFIKDVAMHVVKSVAEIENLMNLGTKNRSVGETAMNKDSSRSHSIFTIYIEASEKDEKGNERITGGKLNLVDLAGSERQSRTQATGDRLKEANKINLSLSALGNVISALVDGKSSHVPYRDSKLTRLLQDSLGGNTKTVMIANVSPASDSYDETLGTLRYASRAKNIKNQPKVNEDPKDAMIREYADEIKRLKMMLENGGGIPDGKKESHHNKEADTIIKKSNSGKIAEFENELKAREQMINDEKIKREKLETMLKEMEQKLLHGGKDSQAGEEEKKKYEMMASKMNKNDKEEEERLRIQKKKEEEIEMIEKKYGNLQEEVEEGRKLIKKLRKKYKNANQDIKDLEREHETNKEDLLDSIRTLERDMKISSAIIANLLSPEELDQVKSRARWSDERDEFVIQPFVIKPKIVKFPKLPGNKGGHVAQDEWTSHENESDGGYEDDFDEHYSDDEDFEDYDSSDKRKVPTKNNKKSRDRKGDNFNTNPSVHNYSSASPIKTSKAQHINNSMFRVNSSVEFNGNPEPINVPSKMNTGERGAKAAYKRNNLHAPLQPLVNPHSTDFDNHSSPNSHVTPSVKGLPPRNLAPIKQFLSNDTNPQNPKAMKLSFNATLVYNQNNSDIDSISISSKMNKVNLPVHKGRGHLEPLKAL